MDQPLLDSLIRMLHVPSLSGVYALGCFSKRVTFRAQQVRAFNLIWALFQTNRLHAGDHVAVVGAGLGGLSATVAALCKGCKVDLFEQASQPCPLQRGNDTRFIHPNILDWPEKDCHLPNTIGIPYLKWTAASVRGVIKQIDVQWQAHTANQFQRLNRFFSYEVVGIGVGQDDKPWVSANSIAEQGTMRQDFSTARGSRANSASPGFVSRRYDAVILAVGFGEERGAAGVPFLSYWENESLHQEMSRPRGPKRVLISGCGDGGLTDALRLRLRNFDHGEFVDRFLKVARGSQSDTLINSLKSIEHEVRKQPYGTGLRYTIRGQGDHLMKSLSDVVDHMAAAQDDMTSDDPLVNRMERGLQKIN